MIRKRLVIGYVPDTDNIIDTWEVEAKTDVQALHMVEEHHPEIKGMDIDIMTDGLDIGNG